jgi:uncharacterized membrane protein
MGDACTDPAGPVRLPRSGKKGDPALVAYSETVYDWLKLFHVLAAVTWVGGDIMIFIMSRRIAKQNDPQRAVGFVHDLGEIGQRVLAPVSIVLIVFAISLVAYSPAWNFTDTWIELAILGYLATFVTGVFFLGPSAGKIEKLIEAGSGPDDPEVQGLVQRTMFVGRIDVAVLVLVVCDMVLKPGR